MTNEWAVVFDRIAETVLPVHTCADCTDRVIHGEAVALKEQWPKQLVQHPYPYEYRDISDTSSADRHWLVGSESLNARRDGPHYILIRLFNFSYLFQVSAYSPDKL